MELMIALINRITLLRVSLIAILLLFIFAHIETINYPYFIEDEATYRVLGSFHKLSLDAGFVWKVFSGAVSGLDASNYRYICALELLTVTGAIIYIFAQTELSNVGILAAIIFLASPISFYVLHLTRPETLHTTLAICIIACCTRLQIDRYCISKASKLIPKQVIWQNHIVLICAMLLNLLLPHIHMFGLVHMPATFFFIIFVIITLPTYLFVRLVIIIIFTVVELLDIVPFLNNSPSFNQPSMNAAQMILSTFSNIYNTPGLLSKLDTAASMENKMPIFLINLFSTGQYLKISTALLLMLGGFGAAISVIRGMITRFFDIKVVLGITVLIFYATFFVAALKMGYVNYSYMTVLIPYAVIGCALGALFFVDRITIVSPNFIYGSCQTPPVKPEVSDFNRKNTICKLFLYFTMGAIIIAIMLGGVGQLYTYSWPLRHTSFSNNIEAIKAALIENNCSDVPYVSAPYQGFISMHPYEMKNVFAPDFIVLYTTNLKFMYDTPNDLKNSLDNFFDATTIDRINKPDACIVATERQLFSLGTFGSYANLKVINFFLDNFTVVSRIRTPFYYNDTFPATTLKKFGYDIQIGAPFLHHGSIEGIFVLKAKTIIDRKLIDRYIQKGL